MAVQKKEDYISSLAIKFARGVGTPISILLHTLFFIGSLMFALLGYDKNTVMLIVTTIVSLEAIYLSLFIQLTVNIQGKHLEDVKTEIIDIQENIEDISDDVSDISEEMADSNE